MNKREYIRKSGPSIDLVLSSSRVSSPILKYHHYRKPTHFLAGKVTGRINFRNCYVHIVNPTVRYFSNVANVTHGDRNCQVLWSTFRPIWGPHFEDWMLYEVDVINWYQRLLPAVSNRSTRVPMWHHILFKQFFDLLWVNQQKSSKSNLIIFNYAVLHFYLKRTDHSARIEANNSPRFAILTGTYCKLFRTLEIIRRGVRNWTAWKTVKRQ